MGDLGSIPGLGRFPGEGNGNPLQCSCLEKPMDRGAWWATVHGVAKSWTWLSECHFHYFHWFWISSSQSSLMRLLFLCWTFKGPMRGGWTWQGLSDWRDGSPLQYSCLENPMDGGAWWATAQGVQRVGHDQAAKLGGGGGQEAVAGRETASAAVFRLWVSALFPEMKNSLINRLCSLPWAFSSNVTCRLSQQVWVFTLSLGSGMYEGWR